MRVIRWIKDSLSHKIEHLRWKNIKSMFKKHGLALVIIIVGWEVVEDVLFPIIFGLLGKYIHPAFYAGIPASIILCFHWIAIPVLWSLWVRLSKKDIDSDIPTDECCDNHH